MGDTEKAGPVSHGEGSNSAQPGRNARENMRSESSTETPGRPLTRPALIVLGGLSAFGPLSMDLYLPALPELSDDLNSSPMLTQVTMTVCMVGLALGQLLVGPLSDRFGRRMPLLIVVGVYTLTSLLCALAPGVATLIALRAVQGLAGGAGMVIARAIVRDLFATAAAARVFSILAVITGVAPVVAPILGGQLLVFSTWRGLFVALALIGAVLLVASALAIEEPRPQPSAGALRGMAEGISAVLRDKRFLGHAMVLALGSSMLFAYISMSSFVLQERYSSSSQAFSFVFALNACGMVVAARMNSTLVGRIGPSRSLRLGVWAGLAATVLLTAGSLGRLPLPVLLVPLFVAVASVAVIMPNATALALGGQGSQAGSAAGVLGLIQFGIGSVLGPAVSAAAGASMVTMASAMLAAAGVGLLALLATGRISASPVDYEDADHHESAVQAVGQE